MEKENETLKTMKEKAIEDFKACLHSVKLTKEKLSTCEEKISNLMNENQKLKVRAAVSFDELTPRPSFIQVSPIFLVNLFFF